MMASFDVLCLGQSEQLFVCTCVSSVKPASDDRQSWPTFWAWFSFRRQSADEIVEPWHVSVTCHVTIV